MWLRQKAHNRRYFDYEDVSPENIKRFVKEQVLCIHSELDELLEALGNWKSHRLLLKEPSTSGILEECVDIWKYLVNILTVVGLESEQFVDEFHRKSKVVEDRSQWEQVLRGLQDSKNVVVLDLDGVLAKYSEHWVRFLRQQGYDVDKFDCDGTHWCPQIPRIEYYELKHKFRENGFESMTVDAYEDAAAFTKGLKDRGYNIVIMSSRPYKQYKRIQTDTAMWLASHDILYDAFIWDNKKREQVLRRLPNMTFMVEDSLEIAKGIAACGYQVYLREQYYNSSDFSWRGIKRVSSLLEILEELDKYEQATE
jgi:FMN phosphatase YigB (HAD superfamily)